MFNEDDFDMINYLLAVLEHEQSTVIDSDRIEVHLQQLLVDELVISIENLTVLLRSVQHSKLLHLIEENEESLERCKRSIRGEVVLS